MTEGIGGVGLRNCFAGGTTTNVVPLQSGAAAAPATQSNINAPDRAVARIQDFGAPRGFLELGGRARHLAHVLPSHETLDRTGVIASVFCAIHCAIAPLLLILTPTLGGIWTHPVSHLAIAALVLPVAAFALRRGLHSHGRRWVVTLGGVGIALVLVGAALPYFTTTPHIEGCTSCDQCCPSFVTDPSTGEEHLHIPPATLVTLAGGISLVIAHMANLRCCGGHGRG